MHGIRRKGVAADKAVTVISSSELSTIRATVTKQQFAATVTLGTEEYAQALSAEHDQIKAHRAQRLKEREDRLASEEAARVDLDNIEKHLRATQRAEQIERASKLLYRDTDKVKTFNSSLLLSDVLEERKQQVEIKAMRAEVIKRREAEHFRNQQEELQVAQAIEEEKKAERAARALAQRDAQLEQIEEMKANFLRERAADRREGELVKQAAKEEMELNRTKALAATARSVAAAKATGKANEQLLLFKEAERLRDKEDDKRIAAYNAAKEAQLAERKKRLDERQAEKDEKRDRTIRVLEAQLLEARQQSDTRLNKQEEEARLAEDNREFMRAEARRREQRAIEASRRQQLALRSEDAARTKEEEAEYVAALSLRNAQQVAAEKELEALRARERRRLAATHLAHAAKHENAVAMTKLRALEEDLQMQLALEEDDSMFAGYVEQRTEEWRAAGRDVKPILIATKKIAKPSLQSA